MPDQNLLLVGHFFGVICSDLVSGDQSRRRGLILADGLVLIALDCHTNQQAGPTLGQQINT